MTLISRSTTRSFAAGAGLFALAILLSGLGTSALAAADIGIKGWGVRGGFSSDPDQFVLGMHADMGEFAQNVRFTPNADIGFGDHFTIFTLNPDITYAVPLTGAGKIYFGGTLGLVYWKWDTPSSYVGPLGYTVNVDTDGTDLGVAGIVGYEFPVEGNPIFVDLKIGITDEYPDLKIMAGYTFRR